MNWQHGGIFVKAGLSEEVLRLPQGSSILVVLDGVVGMVSILLYHSWIRGLR